MGDSNRFCVVRLGGVRNIDVQNSKIMVYTTIKMVTLWWHKALIAWSDPTQ